MIRGLFACIVGALALLGPTIVGWLGAGDALVPTFGLTLAAGLATFIARPRRLNPVAYAPALAAVIVALAIVSAVAFDAEPALQLLSAGATTAGGAALAMAVLRFMLERPLAIVSSADLGPTKIPVARGEEKAKKRLAAEIADGDRIQLDAGSIVPADGTLESGDGFADERALTGSDVPRVKSKDDPVFAGTEAQIPELVLRAAGPPEKSLIARRDRHVADAIASLQRDGRIAIGLAIGIAASGAIAAVIAMIAGPGIGVGLPAAAGLLLAATAAGPIVALRASGARLWADGVSNGLVPAAHEDLVALARVRRWQIDPRLLAVPGEVEAVALDDLAADRVLGIARALLEESDGPEAEAIAAEVERRRITAPRPAALRKSQGVLHGTVGGERWMIGPLGAVQAEEKSIVPPDLEGPLAFLAERHAICWVLARPNDGVVGALGIGLQIESDARIAAHAFKATVMPGLPDSTRRSLAEAAGIRCDGSPIGRRDATLAAAESPPPSGGLLLRVVEPQIGLPLGRDQGTFVFAPALSLLPDTVAAIRRRWRLGWACALGSAALPLAIAAVLASLEWLGPATGAALGIAGLFLARVPARPR